MVPLCTLEVCQGLNLALILMVVHALSVFKAPSDEAAA